MCCYDGDIPVEIPARERDVDAQMEELRNAVLKTRGLALSLIERLVPLIRPQKEAASPDQCEPEGLCPLAEEMRTSREIAQEAGAIISDLLESIEL